jgi:Holliday junction resolvase
MSSSERSRAEVGNVTSLPPGRSHPPAAYIYSAGLVALVGSTASGYERELKGLLQGEEDALRRYSKLASSPADLARLRKLSERPFLVVRAAGSHGFDLVALREGIILPIEVKASSSPAIHFTAASGRGQAQFQELITQTRKARLVLLYAYRLVGGGEEDPWRLYAADAGPEKGFGKLIGRNLPLVEKTAQGNQVLRFSNGKPLLEFLDWVQNVLLGGA